MKTDSADVSFVFHKDIAKKIKRDNAFLTHCITDVSMENFNPSRIDHQPMKNYLLIRLMLEPSVTEVVLQEIKNSLEEVKSRSEEKLI